VGKECVAMRYLFPLNQKNQQRQLEKLTWVFPAQLAMVATKLRDDGHDVVWDGEDDGSFDKVYDNDYMLKEFDFSSLPYPDRVFTDAKNKKYQRYGNYRRHPATHSMVSNLCWFGRCTFCQDTERLKAGEKRGVRSVESFIEEIDNCISLGFKEIFDDSGTFPVGKWLEEFCSVMVKSGRNKKILLGCNMKPVKLDYKMMADAGFKFMLVGIESANQKTVDIIQKGQRSEDVIPIMKSMADAGLAPHGTFMSSYGWETEEEEQNTIDLCHYLLKKGYLKTAQASIYSPPHTEPDPNSIGHKRIPRYFDAYKSPEFIFRKISETKKWEDFSYLIRGGRLVIEEKWRKFIHAIR
jgi:radical SAM superfamily enzyme YgiQ (UPF0313 family)